MVDEIEITERDAVTAWRIARLFDAGYPPDLAELIAKTDVDLHEAVRLVEDGCSPRLAAEILT